MTPLRMLLLIVAACLTTMATMLVVMPGAAMGRVLFSVGSHGLHQGDIPAIGLWLIGMGACAEAWRRT